MDDQIVNFETAKLLKEIIDFPYNIPNWYSQLGTLNYSHTCSDEYHLLKGLAAPTQTCLRRWLRENYDIHIVIDPYEFEEGTTVYEWTVISNIYKEEYEDDENFSSYEEALELALQEGLNLIKSKNK